MKTLATSLNSSQADGFYELTHGIDVDPFLFREEIQVQKAWVAALTEIKILTATEEASAVSVLEAIEREMAAGSFKWVLQDEDIHMNIEREVTDRLGELGKKIHIGRSRNDLIATTLKLYLANQCKGLAEQVGQLASRLLELSERDMDIIVPSYTHSQAAQPIRMSQIWNFHALNFISDIERLKICRENILKICPLGSAAIAGTHLEVDLTKTARDLSFQMPPVNSVHGVSNRDFVIEVAQCLSFLGLHISRLCDEVIFLSSSPVKVLLLPAEWSSGSSIMPNKRNPDFFEVVRAKSKRLVGVASEVMQMSMGFGAGYSSDFHEQKRSIVLAVHEARKMLTIMPAPCAQITIDSQRAGEQLTQGHILATDLANKLVRDGGAFRDVYRKIAEMIVSASPGEQVGVNQISFIESVESKSNFGGTSSARIKESQKLLRGEIERHL